MSTDQQALHDVVLEIDELRVLYGRHCVLRVPSLRLERGGLLLLRGPNASGKSSLLLGLAGIGPTLRGKASFMGKELARLSATQRTRMGLRLLPQGRRIFSRLSAQEHATLASFQLAGRHSALNKTTSWMRHLLESRSPAATASGGEAKAILLRALLASPPQLLMLDEPFAGLDANGTAQVLTLIHSARLEGAAGFVTDHTGLAQREYPTAQLAEIISTAQGHLLQSSTSPAIGFPL